MAKVNKNLMKKNQIRDRVSFHRKLKDILDNENYSVDRANDSSNQGVSYQENQPNDNDNKASTERLRQWALKYNISKRAVSDLLKILISLGMIWLPKDSRTLLSTPRYIKMNNLTNGKLWLVFFIGICDSCF